MHAPNHLESGLIAGNAVGPVLNARTAQCRDWKSASERCGLFAADVVHCATDLAGRAAAY